MNRVVITGIGIIAPNGIDKNEYWNNLFAGKSFIEKDPNMTKMGIKSKVNCKIKNFNIADFIEDKDFLEHLKQQDRFIQFGVAAGERAFIDADFKDGDICGEDVGIVFSSALGGTPSIQKIFEDVSEYGKKKQVDYKPVGEYFYNAGMVNYPAALLAHRHGFKNICTSISTGCTGGIDAIGNAFELIKDGEAKVMLAGASEAPFTEITYATLDVIGALSVAEGEPSRSSRPFDKTRAGFVIGEGSACFILEELEHALKRKSKIYGEVVSYASVNNAYHMTDLLGEGDSMARAINIALNEADIKPETIDYINAHGSSTQQNDLYETNAFKSVFGDLAYDIPISSTKSMIGHALSAASAMGTAAVLGSLNCSKIHPTINLEVKDEKCDLDYVPNIVRDKNVRRAMVTASGFGGIHSVGIFDKFEEGVL